MTHPPDIEIGDAQGRNLVEQPIGRFSLSGLGAEDGFVADEQGLVAIARTTVLNTCKRVVELFRLEQSDQLFAAELDAPGMKRQRLVVAAREPFAFAFGPADGSEQDMPIYPQGRAGEHLLQALDRVLRASFGDQRRDHPAQHFGIALARASWLGRKPQRSAGPPRAMFGHSRGR